MKDTSRKGDLAEIKAMAWGWAMGYEVFRNAGSSGPVDMVFLDRETGAHILVDVKMLYVQKVGDKTYINKPKITSEQKRLGVKVLVVGEDDIDWYGEIE